jgi:hypothetical protein
MMLCVGEGHPYIGQHISNTQKIWQVCAGDEKSVLTIPKIPVAKSIVPDLGNKANSCIELPYRPARLQQPYAGVNYIPQSGTMNLA